MKEDKGNLLTKLRGSSVRRGLKYRHYKGDVYEVKDLIVDESTNEIFVVYFNIDDWSSEISFSRPLSEWNEVIDDKGTKRFEWVSLCNVWLTTEQQEKLRENNYIWIGENVKPAGRNIKWYQKLWANLCSALSVGKK